MNWVGGKCMDKLEPVIADEGELIIYAPHVHAARRATTGNGKQDSRLAQLSERVACVWGKHFLLCHRGSVDIGRDKSNRAFVLVWFHSLIG